MNHSSYTIGWVCALPLEMAAAVAMLDEKHPGLPQPAADQNTYCLGKIGVHNIVIVCLPAGTTGIGSAAAVVERFYATFPSLRFCLMVGVGGGAPTEKNDVRLGDVVVSVPSETYPGVIQYDSGRMLQDGEFQRTGALDRSPRLLLGAVANLRAKHMLDKPLSSTFTQALPPFQTPGSDNDLLFKSDYIHQDKNSPDCDTCNKDNLADRPPRPLNESKIHLGLIASANVVMRDSAMRDNLAKEHGILCFEMEAAGIMNILPCLVIRGICDYSDSHKNKSWQPYAAITAAAYTKELLGVIPEAQPLPLNPVADTKKSKNNVPFRQNDSFIGRESHLSELSSTLLSGSSSNKIALFGLGGVGKTQIALELAHQALQSDPSFPVFWIVGANFATVDQSFQEIAELLNVNRHVDPDEDLKMLVKQHLSRNDSGRWLMIIDNADDKDAWFGARQPSPDSKALIDFIPVNSSGSILFTTRDRRAAVKMAGRNAVEIQKLTDESARDLFLSHIINKEAIDSDEKLHRLITSLCNLPLALVQAAAYINANFPPVNLSTYLSYVEGAERGFLKILSEGFEEDARYRFANDPVATTWWISFEQIQKQNPLAVTFLSRMACLEPDQIPESVVALYPPSIEANEALSALSAYSLITLQKETWDLHEICGSLLDMHRLVHICTRNWLKNNNLFTEWLSETSGRLYAVLDSLEDYNRSLWSTLKPHAYRIILESEEEKLLDDRHDLMQLIAWYLVEEGKYHDAEDTFRRALEIRQRTLGENDTLTRNTTMSLIRCLLHQNRFNEAETLCLAFLETAKPVLLDEHYDILAAEGMLAHIYAKHARFDKAETLFSRVLQSQKSNFGEQDDETLRTAHNLASLHQQRGQYKAAEELYVRIIEARERKSGKDHAGTISAKHNLALVYIEQQRLEEAEIIYLQVIEIEKRVLGEEHPETLTTKHSLGRVYSEQKRLEEAELLFLEVVEIRERVLGEENPQTLATKHNLASLYSNQGRLEEAESLIASVAEMQSCVLGEEHPHTIMSKHNYSVCLWELGNKHQALDMMKAVYASFLQIYGEDHSKTQVSAEALSEWEYELENGSSLRDSSTSTPVAEQVAAITPIRKSGRTRWLPILFQRATWSKRPKPRK